ncbi:MAG TPA: Gfo/Idh/MocA family oxidoreductase [Opitutaceae bacterium]|nr:Gfo/Idh/MocA family oxidoreductase [Opitutaceae bacterium]
MSRKIKVGIIGCGKICDQYFKGCRAYEVLEVVACADLDVARARAKALEYGVPRASSVAELLAAPDIDLVVNLTVPQAHAEVNEAALLAGKHVYAEKPFALNSHDGAKVLALARERGLLVGCAPDTFLGGGFQTARKALDDGLIGRPVAAFGFMLGHGPESWHPSPEFYYQRGGGPMFDMGPYYITALVNLLGPVARVCGSAQASFPERLITSQPLAGKKVRVEVPTHYTGTMDFAGGAVATLTMSFDVWPGPVLPRIVVYGSDGTLDIPDPNMFDGSVRFFRPGVKEAETLSPAHSLLRGRGTGVADMAYSILRRDRPHRASGELAHHVVEVMEAFERSSTGERHERIHGTCARPTALPAGLADSVLDA